jgi:glutathione S-transferase
MLRREDQGDRSMLWVQGVVVIALLQLIVFSWLVGRARGRYGVKAPATTGHEMFERYNRAHLNSLEQIVVFVPAIFLFANFFDPRIAAALGLLYVIGRSLYFIAYVRAPGSRALGFGIGSFAVFCLLAGSLVGVVIHLARG